MKLERIDNPWKFSTDVMRKIGFDDGVTAQLAHSQQQLDDRLKEVAAEIFEELEKHSFIRNEITIGTKKKEPHRRIHFVETEWQSLKQKRQ